MSRCLLCGNEAAYNSFQWQWCPTPSCRNFRKEVEIIQLPNYTHDDLTDEFLGFYSDSFWGLIDLYLSKDLKSIKIRWSSEDYAISSELIDDIPHFLPGGNLDDAFVEGYKRAQQKFGV